MFDFFRDKFNQINAYFKVLSNQQWIMAVTGAVYRVPLLMLYTKYESSEVSDKQIFESCI